MLQLIPTYDVWWDPPGPADSDRHHFRVPGPHLEEFVHVLLFNQVTDFEVRIDHGHGVPRSRAVDGDEEEPETQPERPTRTSVPFDPHPN
jgi:hypothetical protein